MRKSIFLVFLILVLCGCQSLGSMFKEPRVSLNSVSVAGINISGVNLIAKVDIENRNAFSIPMPKVDWELFVNDSSFTQGTVEDDRTIGSLGKISLDVPINVSFERLFRSFNSLAGLLGSSAEVPYKVEMGLKFPIAFLENIVYKLDHSGTFPLR